MQTNTLTGTQTAETLVALDNIQLVDLLQQKTHLLVTAKLARINDKAYIRKMTLEVEQIQLEVKNRMDLPLIL